MPDTVLVTGGTGYVAGWCIAQLLESGYDVRATVRDTARAERLRQAVVPESARTGRLEFAVADLNSDEGWTKAADGCAYVLHVASPLSADASAGKDEERALLRPARDGALRVLRAAADAGVRRVVMTSAANAASPTSYTTEGVTDETLWTDLATPGLPAYRRSKTAAERAAWDFMAAYDGPMTLTTILPGAVFGPVLSPEVLGSARIIARLVGGAMPGTPHVGLEVVDVRDLADIHIRAMHAPEAAGQRFLATGEFLWMYDIALALRDGLGEAGHKVPTRRLPNLVVRAATLFDPSLRDVMPALGRRNRHSTAKAQTLLGWLPRPGRDSVLDCARSLIDHGAVPG
ncbi:NAD-dependent epimerase/dehydratase family protein [Streptomyces sp. HNM0575]|uniref:NAD-dependent epimerase/dehydratase family protein n=1 Tax=Streptomyces sp. HNM0575 TaxID=2716338 RepID=UPI00145DF3D4|nr:NAD-dependent epimerase/dehydratase family protein [Streptomyces sp. HNM0575]NLU73393.1 NAD-dependent epimerase/dehydratase family protein [Streptomyces sp. HNM0575]